MVLNYEKLGFSVYFALFRSKLFFVEFVVEISGHLLSEGVKASLFHLFFGPLFGAGSSPSSFLVIVRFVVVTLFTYFRHYLYFINLYTLCIGLFGLLLCYWMHPQHYHCGDLLWHHFETRWKRLAIGYCCYWDTKQWSPRNYIHVSLK